MIFKAKIAQSNIIYEERHKNLKQIPNKSNPEIQENIKNILKN
jgi:hypothetical protein